MSRPVLSLWPYLWRASSLFVLLAVLALQPDYTLAMSIGKAAVWVVLFGWRFWWLWLFARQVRRFRTVSEGEIVLHHAPELNAVWDMSVVLRRCREELDHLTKRFGFPLRGRVVVFLFASYRDIGKIFGARYGGMALVQANAIVIACDTNVLESMRHEFAHLFSAWWSAVAPPFLSEGLSVCLQGTECGQPLDEAARPWLGNRDFKLPLLLKPRFFFDESRQYACYVLAGSFTGFLIRRYGWPQYRKLFRLCRGTRLRAKFQKCLGVTLEKAEWQWRTEVAVMTVHNRRLRRDRSF
jgi:hypothetical protein